MPQIKRCGIPGKEISLMQAQAVRSFEISDPDEEAFFQGFNEKMIEIAASEKQLNEKRKELMLLYKEAESFLKTIVPEGTNTDTFINQLVNRSLSPWMQYFYNPSDELEKVTIPVLSLNGSKDVQVDAKINQSAIKEALEKAGNKDYKIVEMT